MLTDRLHNPGKRAQGLAEYAILLAAVAAAVVAGLTPVGAAIVKLLSSVTSAF